MAAYHHSNSGSDGTNLSGYRYQAIEHRITTYYFMLVREPQKMALEVEEK